MGSSQNAIRWKQPDDGICKSTDGRVLLELSADRRWHVSIDGHHVSEEPIKGLDSAKRFAESKLGTIERFRPAFEEGRKARLLGYRESHCPYEPDTLESGIKHELWHDGYNSAVDEALEIEMIRRSIVEAGLDTFAELLRCAGVDPDEYTPAGQHSALERATRDALGLPDVAGE